MGRAFHRTEHRLVTGTELQCAFNFSLFPPQASAGRSGKRVLPGPDTWTSGWVRPRGGTGGSADLREVRDRISTGRAW